MWITSQEESDESVSKTDSDITEKTVSLLDRLKCQIFGKYNVKHYRMIGKQCIFNTLCECQSIT